MGFLDAIEREKQQSLQEEARVKQEVVETDTAEVDNRGLAQKNVQLFLDHCKTVAQLFGDLNQSGYPDYLKAVARITSSILAPVLYMSLLYRYEHPYFLKELASSHTQEIMARERIDEEIDKSGLCLWNGVRIGIEVEDPSTQFFGDNSGDRDDNRGISAWDFKRTVTKRIVNMKGLPMTLSGEGISKDTSLLPGVVPEKKPSWRDKIAKIFSTETAIHYPTMPVTDWFTEPQVVGMGFRFVKLLKSNQSAYRSLSKPGDSCYVGTDTKEVWYSAVYVRAQASKKATITGNIQRTADISGLQPFDNLLEEVMKQPAVFYCKEYEWRVHSILKASDFG